uniref:K Homology domain-containing protein n=1 Tax=Solanum lycopersicum TaxID=4081 RepID=A0A3Q7GH25_SOLLC
MCKETCASICVLEGTVGNADQIVLISEVSPAMDAAIRIFICVAGLNNDDRGAVAAFVSSKLLVASAQAIHLIAISDYQDPYLLDHGTAVYSKTPRSTLPRYGQDIVTKITKVMHVPLGYAEEIIGAEGFNIAYIRRTSGATLTVQGSRVPQEITIEIKGTSSKSSLTTTKSQPHERMGRVSLSLVLFRVMETLILHHLRFHLKVLRGMDRLFHFRVLKGYGSSSLGGGYNSCRYQGQ